MKINDKLKKLREDMLKNSIDAVLIPSTDPHASEYVHSHWMCRNWISGFTGSSGTVVVTANRAILWTDFRYYIQAEREINGSEFELFKQGLLKTPSISDFIKSEFPHGGVLGFNGTVVATLDKTKYEKEFEGKNITINMEYSPIDKLWVDRPSKPFSMAYKFSKKYTGEDSVSKLKKVRDKMKEKGVDLYIISSLADIAWLYNIRGGDMDFTPLLVGYGIVTMSDAYLFVDENKIDSSLKEILGNQGIDILPYNKIRDFISKLNDNFRVYYMPQFLNSSLSGAIPKESKIVTGDDFTMEFKALKNKIEVANIRLAMEKDGVALVKFFKNLEEKIAEGEVFTEFSLSEIIREYRLGIDGCKDESFAPIVGYKENGALCHYKANNEEAKKIENNGLLLIDSGGQYFEGTTDITRTISIGTATREEILHYTLVLKGHIDLAMAQFPESTTGAALDVLARKPLWDMGLDFGHGTGHGVGFYLGVHEGPQGISPRSYKATLKKGMIISNEPGLYIEGSHGIRIENLVLVKSAIQGLEKEFLDFETLTMYPYDLTLIDKNILTTAEIDWINNYHNEVVTRLSPYLNSDEINWLKNKASRL